MKRILADQLLSPAIPASAAGGAASPTRQNQNLTPFPSSSASQSLAAAVAGFLRSLEGQNRSPQTLKAYRLDLSQFVQYLAESDITVQTPADVRRADVVEYFAELHRHGLTGVSRARKLASLRAFFRYCLSHELVSRSPVEGMEPPKRERVERAYLRPEEYHKLLYHAGASPRDVAILQVFLQTGIRVSELVTLETHDLNLSHYPYSLTVRGGKGMADRTIELESIGVKALKTWLEKREKIPTASDCVFLNRFGEGMSARAVEQLVARYRDAAELPKHITCHSLRHTFTQAKAEFGVDPYQLQAWLGHRNLATTQKYLSRVKTRKNAHKVMEASGLK
jgi:site-specific recombinase XerD